MKRVLFLIGMLMVLNVPSQALSGAYSQLKDGCRYYSVRGNVDAYAECMGYVSAVENILAYWANDRFRACIPFDSVTNGQLAAVINKSVRDHPEVTAESASALVAAALRNTFPCRQ